MDKEDVYKIHPFAPNASTVIGVSNKRLNRQEMTTYVNHKDMSKRGIIPGYGEFYLL